MSDEEVAVASRLAEARKRKERREARIKTGGTSRLKKISGVGGGLVHEDVPIPLSHEDPPEVDISSHFDRPSTAVRPSIATSTRTDSLSADQPFQRRLFSQESGFIDSNNPNPFTDFNPNNVNGPPENGQMDVGLEQIMKAVSMSNSDGSSSLTGLIPPAFFSASGLETDSLGRSPPMRASLSGTPAALWRLIHFAIFAAMGLYLSLATSIPGTSDERSQTVQTTAHAVRASTESHDIYDGVHRQYFFYAFATAEALLLTSRIFLDRNSSSKYGTMPGGSEGVLGMALNFAPPAVQRTVKIGLRYSQIFSTVRSDLLVCIFFLGVYSWTRG